MHYESGMPTIMRFRRCRIEMYFGDHALPHFHSITAGDQRVAVAISTTSIIAGVADKQDLTEAIAWARENKEVLNARWKKNLESE